MTSDRTVQFKLLLSEDEKRRLEILGIVEGVTPTDTIRTMIRERFDLRFGQRATSVLLEDGQAFIAQPGPNGSVVVTWAKGGFAFGTFTRHATGRGYTRDWSGVNGGAIMTMIATALGLDLADVAKKRPSHVGCLAYMATARGEASRTCCGASVVPGQRFCAKHLENRRFGSKDDGADR